MPSIYWITILNFTTGTPVLSRSFVACVIWDWRNVVAGLLSSILGQSSFPADTLLSVNLPGVPPDKVKGVRVTSLGRRRYSESLTRAKDPSGREYFWIGGGTSDWVGTPDSDFRVVQEGYVSVTPLHLDLTNYRLIEEIRAWDLSL